MVTIIFYFASCLYTIVHISVGLLKPMDFALDFKEVTI